MQRRPLSKTAFLTLLTAACGSALALGAGCSSDTPATPGKGGSSPGGSGSAGSAPVSGGSGGAGNPGGAGPSGGVGVVGGSGGTPAAGGSTVGGGAPNGGTGTGGGGGEVGPACKAVTPLNGANLDLKATDISAFRYATGLPGNVTKMAYDPVGKVIVILQQNGTMLSVSSEVPLPTTAATTAVTTTAPYPAGGYAANQGYGDHRGIAFDAMGNLYVLAVQGGGNVGVNIKKGVPGQGGARTWSTIVTTSMGFAAGGTNFDHSFSGIAVSPDGASLYFSSGSRTDHGETEAGAREVPLSSAVFKVPTTGMSDLKNTDAGVMPFLFADGTRNAFDMAFNAAGDLIGCDNGPDMDLPDEINFLEQGKHYGFPWRFGAVDNPVLDAAYVATGDKRLHTGYQAVNDNKYVADTALAALKPAGVMFTDPITNMGPDANWERVDRNADATKAATGLAGITGHRSPLGLTFDTPGALCGEYYKAGFVASYGSLPQGGFEDQGKDLLLLKLVKGGDGKYTMSVKQIAAGIAAPMDSVLVGNRLYTVGFGNGAQILVFALPTP